MLLSSLVTNVFSLFIVFQFSTWTILTFWSNLIFLLDFFLMDFFKMPFYFRWYDYIYHCLIVFANLNTSQIETLVDLLVMELVHNVITKWWTIYVIAGSIARFENTSLQTILTQTHSIIGIIVTILDWLHIQLVLFGSLKTSVIWWPYYMLWF